MKAETSKEQSEATMDDSGLVEQGTTLQGRNDVVMVMCVGSGIG